MVLCAQAAPDLCLSVIFICSVDAVLMEVGRLAALFPDDAPSSHFVLTSLTELGVERSVEDQ